MFSISFFEDILKKDDFDQDYLGLTFIDSKSCITIYSDPFKTTTLYIFKNNNLQLMLPM